MFANAILPRQRLLDFFLGLSLQVIGLALTFELQRAQSAVPFLGLAVGIYAAASLASLYFLVVAEIKPVLVETQSFVFWLLCHVAFVAALRYTPPQKVAPRMQFDAGRRALAAQKNSELVPLTEQEKTLLEQVKTVDASVPVKSEAVLAGIADVRVEVDAEPGLDVDMIALKRQVLNRLEAAGVGASESSSHTLKLKLEHLPVFTKNSEDTPFVLSVSAEVDSRMMALDAKNLSSSVQAPIWQANHVTQTHPDELQSTASEAVNSLLGRLDAAYHAKSE